MNCSCVFHRVLRAAIFGAMAALSTTVLSAQSAISVTDSTGWNNWTTSTGTVMVDAQNDQQTGQHSDDYVGDATHYGMQQKAGTIGGVDSLMFRFRFDDFAGNDKFGGNGGNVGLGLDLYTYDASTGTYSLGSDGAIDVIMVMSESSGNVNNRTRTVSFGTPGADANTGPSTTSWTIDTNQATKINLALNSTYDLAATNDGYNFNSTQDAWLTFAISFADLSAGINAYNKAGAPDFTMSYTSLISYIAFTSTQTNALNQDLFGANKASLTQNSADWNLSWAELGAITPPQDAFGRVPEPATYAQLATLLAAGGFIAYRRRAKRPQTTGVR